MNLFDAISKSPSTPKVPATDVFPVAAATVNLFDAISKSPSIPVAPVTSNFPDIVTPSELSVDTIFNISALPDDPIEKAGAILSLTVNMVGEVR